MPLIKRKNVIIDELAVLLVEDLMPQNLLKDL